MPETTIYREFERLLAERRVPVLAFRTNAGKRIIESEFGVRAIALLPAGFSDYLVLLNGGRARFIEFKAGKAKQNAAQLRFEASVVALGFVYRVHRSAEEAVNDLTAALADRASPAASP